jgi:hypothetical protein
MTKDKLFAVERGVLQSYTSNVEHMTIHVQQRYIPKSAPQSLNTYIEIAPELQQRGISLDESIPASEIVYRGELREYQYEALETA